MPKGKAAVASKVAAKPAKVSTTKASTDFIFATAQEVENLTATKAFALVETLSTEGEQNNFKLGGVLAVILDKCEEGDEAWLGGCKSFADLCDAKFGMQRRKAFYLVSIYRNLTEKSIPYSALHGLGWTKIALLAPVLTAKNYETWSAKAKKLPFKALEDAVRKIKEKGSQANEEDFESDVTTMTFKLKKDQKEVVKEALTKAKSETNTEFDSVAIANLATAYLGGAVSMGTAEPEAPSKPKKQTKAEKISALKGLAQELGLEATLEAVGEVFPDANIEVVV